MYPELHAGQGYAAASFYMLVSASLLYIGSKLAGNPAKRLVDAAMPYLLTFTPMAALIFILFIIS